MVAKTQQCFTDEWRRTKPDLAVYLPAEPSYYPEGVDHLLVDYTPGGDLLAIWTMATQPMRSDFSVVYARSTDEGQTWTAPQEIYGHGPRPGPVSQFGFPVISRSGRIYVFYNKTTGQGSPSGSMMRCKYSDDDGHIWIDGGVDIPWR